MSRRTNIPCRFARSRTALIERNARSGAIASPIAVGLTEMLASSRSATIRSIVLPYWSTKNWTSASFWTHSPRTSTVAQTPSAFSSRIVRAASSSVSPAM